MSNLTRYNLEWFNRTKTMDNFHQMVACDEGAWVKFDDIKELLNSSHNSARDEICADCDGSGLETRIETTGSKCGSCGGSGRKLSPVA